MPQTGRNLVIYPADDPGDALYPRFFPEMVPLEWSIEFSKHQIPGRAVPVYQWIAGGARPISIELRFDNEFRGNRDWPSTTPPAAIRWFERNIPPFDKGEALGHQPVLRFRPVFRLILFENLFVSEVVITTVRAEIEQFDPKTGYPARVVATVQMERFEPLLFTDDWKRNETSLARVSEARDALGYHVLPGMFEQEGKDPLIQTPPTAGERWERDLSTAIDQGRVSQERVVGRPAPLAKQHKQLGSRPHQRRDNP